MFERFKRKIQPLINMYHLVKATLANLLFGFPSRSLKVIGVTGTDGKTTTAHLIYHILKTAGKRASIISSVYAKIAEKEHETGLHTTTPDAVFVQKFLKQAKDAGEEYFILEATSHALDQNRVSGISFTVSTVTNITKEHLDYHKTYENYIHAKAKLLLQSKESVINRDDESFPLLNTILKQAKKKFYTYGFSKKADFAVNIKKLTQHSLADFNAYNYLAAYGVCSLLGLTESVIVKALRSFQLPPGRLEVVYEDGFKAIVDFAHTPNSFMSVLSHVRKNLLQKEGRLIHVFGAAGLRDFKKRSDMGEASAGFSDVVILTEEDYRTEDPVKICKEIAGGLEKRGFTYVASDSLNNQSSKVYTIIITRDEAFQKAAQIAKEEDIVITTGKSHEKSLARGKREYPWDEEKALIEAIRKNSQFSSTNLQ